MKGSFAAVFEQQRKTFEKKFPALLKGSSLNSSPAGLRRAMLYSLNAGGKRLRPVLVLESSGITGVPLSSALPMAAALECLHTYSLIHDDLPALDNDDFRRGRPSAHRKFGEDTAIVSGDALQALAFELMAAGASRVASLRYFAAASGAAGMAGGQYLDLKGSGKKSASYLENMHRLKTGRLITAAIVIPFLETQSDQKFLRNLEKWALGIGRLFQLTDDILDVRGSREELGKSAGKDAAAGKLTFPSRYGLAKAERMAAAAAQDLHARAKILFPESDLYSGLPGSLVTRKS